MTSMLKPDICIIGGGFSGVSAAMEAAALGMSVVLAEKDAVGGRWLKFRIPAQALLAAARHAQGMREGTAFGIAGIEPEISARTLNRHIADTVAAATRDISAERLIALGVRVIPAQAVFRDRRTILAGDHEIRAGHMVIASGSDHSLPQIEGLSEVDLLTPETIVGLARLPSRLVVIGAGTEGLEMAQAHARLGCAVTVVDEGAALPGFDPELTARALPRLREEGVDIHEHTRILKVSRRNKTGMRLHIETADGEEEFLDGSHLLVAAPRMPALSELNLMAAGVGFADGALRLDRELRTTNKRVFAVGSAAGNAYPTSAHALQARIAVRAAARQDGPAGDPLAAPHMVHIDPPVVYVGMDEASARKEHKAIHILRWPFSENERARAERRTEGFVKLITDRRERILGAGIVGARADETIGTWSLALAKGLSVRDLSEHFPGDMTFAEAGARAARSYFKHEQRRRAMDRLLKALGLKG